MVGLGIVNGLLADRVEVQLEAPAARRQCRPPADADVPRRVRQPDLDTVLQEVVDGARVLTGARYGLIAAVDDAGRTRVAACRLSTQLQYPETCEHPGVAGRKGTGMPQVNIRTSSERLAVIDRAAAIRGVSRTEFVLRSSEAAAIEILNERPVIALDDEAWDDFVAALDAPVEIDPAV